MNIARSTILRTLAILSLLWAQAAAEASVSASQLARKPDAWFAGDEAKTLLAHLLSWQTPAGGWCKALDLSAAHGPAGGQDSYGGWGGTPTIDNGATYTEIRLLARAFALTGRAEYRAAALRGLEFLLARQYPNGGWPQRSPLDGKPGYGARITFNDGAMTGVMELMRDVASGTGAFAFVDEPCRARASEAFRRGIDCILKCQVRIGGVSTVWCAQHDEQTLAPAGARSYEPPSLSGGESAKIVKLLMGLDAPDARVREAVEAACAWYERSKITGKRLKTVEAPGAPNGKDLVLVDDPAAPPLWARFYDLEHNRPIFLGRDGVPRFALSEIPHERRNGYDWLGGWGADVLKAHAKWRAKWAAPSEKR